MKYLLPIAVIATFAAPEAACAQGHAGLLGKQYLRGSYIHTGVDNAAVKNFDSSLQGYDIEFNTPLTFLTSNMFGVDAYAEIEDTRLDGSFGAATLDSKVQSGQVGVRVHSCLGQRIRPFIGLGAAFVRAEATVLGARGAASEDTFVASVGAEFDLTNNLATRHDVELPVNDLDLGSYEGTLIYWASDSFFLRSGITVPFDETFSVGGLIGGGIAF